jgi:rhodanese-related sulfurtransferase
MKNHNNGFLDLVNKALRDIPEYDIHQVKNKMDSSELFALVDVREDREWVQGNIPSSIHLGKGVIERDISNLIPNLDTEIILYCQGGYRSALAGESIKTMGYTNVLSMSGGFGDWVNNNYPVRTEEE